MAPFPSSQSGEGRGQEGRKELNVKIIPVGVVEGLRREANLTKMVCELEKMVK
jgi:hypothetical protein